MSRLKLLFRGALLPVSLALAPVGTPMAGERGEALRQIVPSRGVASPRYEDDSLMVRMVLRTPDQLTAFYLGRGFNQAAIDQILATCFLTPIVHNKTTDVLWLTLDDWRFSRGDKDIPRLGRDYWTARWAEAELPLAQQSTFGWTLLPEVRDLRPDEGAGGSVVIPRQDRPFTLTMRLPTGANKQGPVKTLVFEDLQCTNSSPAP